MVFIWSSGWGPGRRRPRRGHGGWGRGYGPGYGHGGYRHGGYRPGYGYRRGNDSCLRDLLLLNTGCCLANALGCGMDAMLLAPATVKEIRAQGTGQRGARLADRMIAAVRVYQREISPKLPPGICRFTPSCSHYAVEALQRHGAARGTWLSVRRLIRCRPGVARRHDPVPQAE
jgi:putative membrane protein insertion efficiency factor